MYPAWSVIQLGNYLSVLISVDFPPTQETLATLMMDVLQHLQVPDICTIDIGVRQIDDREVQWSQTIELVNESISYAMTTEPLPPESVDSTLIPEPDTINPSSLVHQNNQNAAFDLLLQRPEMVVLLAFTLMLVLWDAYVQWMEDIDPALPLTSTQLARRLGVKTSTLNRMKDRPNFSQWSQELDPDGVAWKYENKVFVPQLT